MAFNVQKIHPIDLQPRKAVGVSLPFSSKAVFSSTYTTQEALKSNLINFFLTGRQERFLNPNFGTNLRALLFNQMTPDTQEEIKMEVRKGIADWFPNIIIEQLLVEESPNTNTITIYIKYSVDQTNIQDELLINFEQ
jgi:phage baseplate assembly protein W